MAHEVSAGCGPPVAVVRRFLSRDSAPNPRSVLVDIGPEKSLGWRAGRPAGNDYKEVVALGSASDGRRDAGII